MDDSFREAEDLDLAMGQPEGSWPDQGQPALIEDRPKPLVGKAADMP